MDLALLSIPYDSGHRERCMGAGPTRLLDAGLAERLAAAGHRVAVETVEAPGRPDGPGERPPTETTSTFGLARRLADRVGSAAAAGRLPVVLSGNCSCCLGILAGLSGAGTRRLGTVWFDAHGDFNTPETTRSGFLDGMAVAIATGRCWRGLASTIPGFRPLPERRVLHVGGREFDPGEAAALEESGVTRVTEAAALEPPLERLAGGSEGVYVHLDVDVLDPARVPSNPFAPPGGLTPGELRDALALIRRHLPIRALAIASYDPAVDPEGGAVEAVCGLLVEALADPGLETREESP